MLSILSKPAQQLFFVLSIFLFQVPLFTVIEDPVCSLAELLELVILDWQSHLVVSSEAYMNHIVLS